MDATDLAAPEGWDEEDGLDAERSAAGGGAARAAAKSLTRTLGTVYRTVAFGQLPK